MKRKSRIISPGFLGAEIFIPNCNENCRFDLDGVDCRFTKYMATLGLSMGHPARHACLYMRKLQLKKRKIRTSEIWRRCRPPYRDKETQQSSQRL